ncbi:DUF5367 family protein [Aquisalibacillus elongatus]|uniref:DUF5367 domain-containing protein n=1 Tax=Aquisalibacillus elongatus TaxID=485577 RepID=A0A3N5B571_9BACI|nr:DUF5367 family protein [Aquisalibacillus elongatus]RPF50710.1 hypothetical protein EDC24_2679 [Aquisalibacillus elongatus]
MKAHLFTVLWAFLIWLFATLFFMFMGEYVLHPPGTDAFIYSIILLTVGTGALLLLITLMYMQFDKSENAPLKLGIVGTVIGLTLDSFSLSFYGAVFPNLKQSQVISFSVWMSAAYALYLLIPILINKKRGQMSFF